MSEPAAKTATTGIYCKACGYDLRASAEAGRCPECGRIFSPGDPKTFRPRPFAAPWQRAVARWAKRGAMLLLVLIILLAGVWGWFYWGWRQEQAVLAETHGMANVSTPFILGDAPGRWLRRRLPGGFVLERVSGVHLSRSATDADLLPLRKLARMEHLVLLCPRITDAGMARLRGFPRLRTLSLLGTGITDAGLEPLRDLPRLEGLSLFEVSVTDAGLVHLAKCPALGSLYLGNTKVTPAGKARLKAALPRCQIAGS